MGMGHIQKREHLRKKDNSRILEWSEIVSNESIISNIETVVVYIYAEILAPEAGGFSYAINLKKSECRSAELVKVFVENYFNPLEPQVTHKERRFFRDLVLS